LIQNSGEVGHDLGKVDAARISIFPLDAQSASSLVVVHDLNVPRGAFSPLEAYPPSIIDADAVLPVTVAEQRFEAIPRRDSQVLGSLGRVPKLRARGSSRLAVGMGI
jgi:hypothetical protein